MITVEKIQTLAKKYANLAREVRQHLHRYPELSFQEYKTAAYLAELLQQLGISFTTGHAGTGIIATVEGIEPESKTIALRCDLDALPIQEMTGSSYASKNEGVMHACGHDVHTACVLATAAILQETKDSWKGTVKLIFQPGEEKLPGGASLLLAEGALGNPLPSAIIAQHVFPDLAVGKVGFRPGQYMASTDEIYVTINGKGGHGALPHNLIDPVLISAHIITSLQQLTSRMAPPHIPCVLSFGKVVAAGSTNVIPAEVKMEGTFRTMNESWRQEAHARMVEMAKGIALSMGGSCEFEIRKGYPSLINHPELTSRSEAAAIEYLGKENVVHLELRMTGEDFSYYSQLMPACFYRLGTRNENRNITSQVHTNTFDIDEAALEIGTGLMCWLAIKEVSASR